ncbi:hypothetical protein HP570_21480 [Brevibacillus sp. RS1.1]|uniref:hypothetical protein n=1 Tax=Brevibacillus sp. RS1.1 TaxID=2738982 RepID=UPI00156B1C59|nr:hypothetical protein [Brevibacillus sp. RS1.1]NRR04789.1 hypothetical protein [Brevibacillus sp. RS1.1]
MYIDFNKFNYELFPDDERLAYIKRDKEAYRNIIQLWLDCNVNEIIERKWEIEEILFIEENSDFIKLLKEAESLYEFGFYTSCIALIVISVEDFTKFLANKCGKPQWVSKTQHERLKLMYEFQLISGETFALMDDIRKTRNDCLHFNDNFKNKDNGLLKIEALNVMNTFKDILKLFLGFKEDITFDKYNEVLLKAMSELNDSENKHVKNFDDMTLKQRNALSQLFDLDITVKPGTELVSKQGVYFVDEIDFPMNEITLIDVSSQFPVIIDLSTKNIEEIKKIMLAENDFVYAAISSNVNKFGQTAEWTLTKIRKIMIDNIL